VGYQTNGFGDSISWDSVRVSITGFQVFLSFRIHGLCREIFLFFFKRSLLSQSDNTTLHIAEMTITIPAISQRAKWRRSKSGQFTCQGVIFTLEHVEPRKIQLWSYKNFKACLNVGFTLSTQQTSCSDFVVVFFLLFAFI
jgi:hypothetical protein